MTAREAYDSDPTFAAIAFAKLPAARRAELLTVPAPRGTVDRP